MPKANGLIPSRPLDEDPLTDLTTEQAIQRFDRVAEYYLGMSGRAFIGRYRRGEFEPLDSHTGALEVYHAMPTSAMRGRRS
jgi:hypothetical protein